MLINFLLVKKTQVESWTKLELSKVFKLASLKTQVWWVWDQENVWLDSTCTSSYKLITFIPITYKKVFLELNVFFNY